MGRTSGFPEYASWIVSQNKKPKEVNFITFNAFGKWSNEDIEFLPPIDKVNQPLKEAIKILEANDIVVNVRYLPLCFAEGFEKNVVGFSQVFADDKEWNFAQQTNSLNHLAGDGSFGYTCGRNTVMNNSVPLNECRNCSCEFICDGISLTYLKNLRSLKIVPIKGEKIFDPLYFQK